MDKKQLTTNKGSIHYWFSKNKDDNADTVFFLHGLTADHSMFDDQITYFEDDYSILVWDAPAHGESRPFETFSFGEVADYIKAILDECACEKVILIGQSLGGYFSQSFIKRYPDRMKGFVSIDSTPYGHAYYSRFDVWILKQIEWMAMCCPFNWMKRAIAKQVSTTQRAYDNMLQMLAPYDKRELCHLMGIGYSAFLADNCELEIRCQVQLILGDQDKTGKVIQYNREWAKQTGYPLAIIDGAAHNSNVDKPQEVNNCIRVFLDSLEK